MNIKRIGGVLTEQIMGLMKYTRTEKWIEAGDRRIFGWLYMPIDADMSRKQPIIIAAHGFNSNTEGLNNELSYICNQGLAAFSFDFCGGGNATKSSGKTTEMSIASEQQDLIAVYKYVKELDFVDSNSIYLFGSSQGGFVTAITAPEIGGPVQGLFLEFPAFCIPDDWAEKRSTEQRESFDFWGVELGQNFLKGLPDYDVFERASLFKGKVLIFHGDSDPVVNLSYSNRLQQAYDHATLKVYPKQGHGFERDFLQDMAEKIAEAIK